MTKGWRVDYDYLDAKGALRERCVPFSTELDARRFVEFLSHVSTVNSAKAVQQTVVDERPESTADD